MTVYQVSLIVLFTRVKEVHVRLVSTRRCTNGNKLAILITNDANPNLVVPVTKTGNLTPSQQRLFAWALNVGVIRPAFLATGFRARATA